MHNYFLVFTHFFDPDSIHDDGVDPGLNYLFAHQTGSQINAPASGWFDLAPVYCPFNRP